MKGREGPSRRRVVSEGSATIAAICASLSVQPQAREAVRDEWRTFALAMFGHQSSAFAIGSRFLAVAGRDASHRLVDEVVARLSVLRSVGKLDASVAAAAIHADFCAERVLCVGGWVLSETEIALCATMAMAPFGPTA
jgi:hypothetical protein